MCWGHILASIRACRDNQINDVKGERKTVKSQLRAIGGTFAIGGENITGAHGAAKAAAAAAGVKAQESAASAALMAVGEVDPVPATARPDELMPPPMVPSASPPPKRGPAADAAAPSFEPGGAPSLAESGQTRLFALPF